MSHLTKPVQDWSGVRNKWNWTSSKAHHPIEAGDLFESNWRSSYTWEDVPSLNDHPKYELEWFQVVQVCHSWAQEQEKPLKWRRCEFPKINWMNCIWCPGFRLLTLNHLFSTNMYSLRHFQGWLPEAEHVDSPSHLGFRCSLWCGHTQITAAVRHIVARRCAPTNLT